MRSEIMQNILRLGIVALGFMLSNCSNSISEPLGCDGVDCGAHGTCDDTSGQAVCVCDDGYHAEGLSCVANTMPCDGVDCGGHGTCDDTSGQAVCRCEHPYSGDNCQNCVAPYEPSGDSCVLPCSYTSERDGQPCYYVFDARDLFFNSFCYNVCTCVPCTQGVPDFTSLPAGESLADLEMDYDTLVFLTSLQGLVNREYPLLYLIASDNPDSRWLELMQSEDIWLQDARRVDVTSLDDLLEIFKNHPDISGSVTWNVSQPYTLNLAYTMAGADNLVVLRQGSPLFDRISAFFPVQNDLSSFTDKRLAYESFAQNYLATGKSAPILTLMSDGYPLYRLLVRGQAFSHLHEIAGWNLMLRDYVVSKKAFSVGYAVHPSGPDPWTEGNVPTGEGSVVLSQMLDTIRNLIGANSVLEAWGYPAREYIFDCNGDGIDESDYVQCGENTWIELLADKGGILRVGGGDMYGVEAANFSFFQHGPGADLVVQPSPMIPGELLAHGYTLGYPADGSFELGGSAWTFDTTNRVVYDNADLSRSGRHFLQANVSSGDMGTHYSIYQDFPLALKKGYRYRFSIHISSPTGSALDGALVFWTFKNEAVQLCENTFNTSSTEWQELNCEFDVKEDGLLNHRLQVYLTTPDMNYSFDDAVLLGVDQVPVDVSKQYVLFYHGDDDFAIAPHIVRTGVYPYTWFDKSDTIPTAWGMSANIADVIPPIFAYFAKTKGAKEWFVMPDSGAGYTNPGILTDAVVDDWIQQSANKQRRFGYRSGWVHNGEDSAAPVAQNATGEMIRRIYKILAPDLIYYHSSLNMPRSLDGSLGVVPMLTGLTYGGADPVAQAAVLRDQLNASPSAFNVFRCIFVSSKHLEELAQAARGLGASFEVLDPVTFSYLYRSYMGGENGHRMSVVAHSIPSDWQAGQSREVSITIRNDGWAIWAPSHGQSCDGEQNPESGCHNLAWGLAALPIR